jgi:uncharacterized protein YcnI
MEMCMRARTVSRLGVLTVGVAAAVLVTVGPASAHVTVNPGNAVQGGFAKLAFRVPNEKDTASTVKLEVVIPTTAPIAFLSVKPVPGWTAVLETTKLTAPIKTDDGEITEAVSKITWTVSGVDSAIRSGQFQEFEVSAGPLPKVDQIIFKALQTYSDGDIVRWIDEPVAGGKEPDHPAPVLKLSAGTATVPVAGPTVEAQAVPTASKDGGASGGWALGIGIAALVAALAALALAVQTRRGTRSAASAGSAS